MQLAGEVRWFDERCMRRAIEIAGRGEGGVEPNPMVGCVLAQGGHIVAEGWHERFGGPHAEINALADAAKRGVDPAQCDLYVTLEPCAHYGKTPPCVQTLLSAGVKRIAVAQTDPFPQVAGKGVAQLRERGVEVALGLCEQEARELNAPYRKLIETGRPWLIAKWAMTLDGKLAARTGDSRWISNDASRAIAHQLRGRVDAILVGIGTALADDPLLTARPAGKRTAASVVLDSRGRLPLGSHLVRTANDAPVMVAVGPEASAESLAALSTAGCEVIRLTQPRRAERLSALLDELGRRRFTNVLIEGGGQVLGDCFDLAMVDEVCAFVAPKIIGGAAAISPVAGLGRDRMSLADVLRDVRTEIVDGDIVVRGRISRVS